MCWKKYYLEPKEQSITLIFEDYFIQMLAIAMLQVVHSVGSLLNHLLENYKRNMVNNTSNVFFQGL